MGARVDNSSKADSSGYAAGSSGPSRRLLSELLFAAVGAVALTAERIDALAEQITARGGFASSEEARAFLHEQVARWREEGARSSRKAVAWAGGLIKELGLVTREEMDELELKLAQLEHRLKLLEQKTERSEAPARS